MGRALMLSLLVLGGCAQAPAPVTVQVPVPVPCPAPPVVARPALPIRDLAVDARPQQVVRAYAASVEACLGYAENLETLLDGYRNGSTTTREP